MIGGQETLTKTPRRIPADRRGKTNPTLHTPQLPIGQIFLDFHNPYLTIAGDCIFLPAYGTKPRPDSMRLNWTNM